MPCSLVWAQCTGCSCLRPQLAGDTPFTSHLLPGAKKAKKEAGHNGQPLNIIGSPNGVRTRVFGVRGRYPRPLDDGTLHKHIYGWRTRIRTWIGRSRVCSPAVRRSASRYALIYSLNLPASSLFYHSSYFAAIAKALFNLALTRSSPKMAMTSKIPGLKVRPVRATRTGWATPPSFRPISSAMSLRPRSSSSA